VLQKRKRRSVNKQEVVVGDPIGKRVAKKGKETGSNINPFGEEDKLPSTLSPGLQLEKRVVGQGH